MSLYRRLNDFTLNRNSQTLSGGAILSPDFMGGVLRGEYVRRNWGIFMDARAGYSVALQSYDYNIITGFKLGF